MGQALLPPVRGGLFWGKGGYIDPPGSGCLGTRAIFVLLRGGVRMGLWWFPRHCLFSMSMVRHLRAMSCICFMQAWIALLGM